MADVLTPEQRRLNMSRIKGKNTKPELIIRKSLYARGLRYRIHVKDVPGRPDLVFPKHRTFIFIHGCFWHGHNCSLFRMPQTREEFWVTKIDRNRKRDTLAIEQLNFQGWRVITVWECSIKGRYRWSLDKLSDKLSNSILSGEKENCEFREFR